MFSSSFVSFSLNADRAPQLKPSVGRHRMPCDWKDRAMWNLFKKKPAKQRLEVGHRVYLSGGYDMTPAWLGDGQGYSGEVIAFIPGQNEKPAAVVKVDSSIEAEGVRGNIVVLELRYVGAEWNERNRAC